MRGRASLECRPSWVSQASHWKLEEQADGVQTRQSKWIKLIRLYLDFGIKLNQNNPAGELDGFGPPVRHTKQLPLWSHLAQIFNIYFTLKLLACLVLQRNFDRLLLDLNGVASGGHQTNRSAELELTIGRMEWLGNAYYEFGFAVEPVYLFTLYMNYMGYVRPLVYITNRGPVIFRLLRMFVNPEREREHFIRADIAHQMDKWLESSENFMRVHRGDEEVERARRCSLTQRVPCNFWLAHARSVRELHELATSGHLKPLNRTPEWAERQVAQSYVKSTAITVLGSALAATALLQVLPRANLVPARLRDTPRDLLFQAELIAYCLWSISSFNFHHMLPLVSAIDGIKFVAELRQLVVNLTRDARLASHGEQQVAATNGRLNRRLMRILIQYKLLKQQIRSTQAIVGFLSTTMIITMLTAPAMVRFQIAHLSAQLRYLYLACCIIIIMACDFLILPTCWLHARCMDLYRSMSFLLAQIDATAAHHQRHQRHHPAARGVAIEMEKLYAEHTVALLRREQSSPEQAARQFSIDTHFMRLTYSNFIGIHFYCGLLLAPMLLRDTSSLLISSSSLLSFL